MRPPRNKVEIKAIRLLADHICSLIERVRGRRPFAGASFAAIGVDSLGAVMFIKVCAFISK